MVILISSPDKIENEVSLLNEMLEKFPHLIAHLRKPRYSLTEYEQLLRDIDAEFHPRIVLHKFYQLANKYVVKGIHLSENQRLCYNGTIKDVISTSFHTLAEAKNAGNYFDYFFCSPVFKSISKENYLPSEDWNIQQEAKTWKEKAVALGGIHLANLEETKQKGFQHIALLGAVWKTGNPVQSFNNIYDKWQKNDQ
jgi:thiamine-phosphate pyrophosphorylase